MPQHRPLRCLHAAIAAGLLIAALPEALLADRLCGTSREMYGVAGEGDFGGSQTCSLQALLVRVRFQDTPSPYPLSFGGVVPLEDSRANALSAEVSGFLEDVSYGQETLDTTLTPVYTMPWNTPSNPSAIYLPPYGWMGVRDWALQEAEQNGFYPANYDRIIVAATWVFPGFNGIAFQAQDVSGFYLNGDWFSATSTHELGHTLGFPHAGYFQSSTTSPIGPGYNVNSGNPFDLMGNATNASGWSERHYNIYSKLRRGWLTIGNGNLAVTDVQGDGLYRIFPADSSVPSGARGLKIAHGNQTYYVEMREQSGNNARLSGGVLVLRENYNDAQLLDLTPATQGANWAPHRGDSPLVIGQTFSDGENGIHITPARKNVNPVSFDVLVRFSAGDSGDDNQAPRLKLVTPFTVVPVGQPLYVGALASDSDNDPLGYYWQVYQSGNQLTDLVFPTSPIFEHSFLSPGNYQVKVIVTDTRGGTVEANITTQVV